MKYSKLTHLFIIFCQNVLFNSFYKLLIFILFFATNNTKQFVINKILITECD